MVGWELPVGMCVAEEPVLAIAASPGGDFGKVRWLVEEGAVAGDEEKLRLSPLQSC